MMPSNARQGPSGGLRREPHGLGAVVLAALSLVAGCGAAPVRSVTDFGTATDSLGQGVAATARGSVALCEHKRDLTLDERIVLGEIDAKGVLAELRKDECATFRRTAELYAKLARQLGSFGLAMRTLALSGDTDYTDQLTEIAGTAKDFGLADAHQPKIDAAAGLSAKLLSWFTNGYASKRIGAALAQSESDVTATLDLLLALLEVYDVQLAGYEQLIQQISRDPEFTVGREGEAPTTLEARKKGQIEIVMRHEVHRRERKQLLQASRAAVEAVRVLHVELVKQAKRDAEALDVEALRSRARHLAGEIAEFRRLAAATVE